MRHQIAGRKLNRPSAQRKALIRNLVKDLLTHERIKTTEAKAKETRRAAEKVITLGKDGTLHARRQALAFLNDKTITAKVFDDIAPRYQSRPGGYTRILKLGPRQGDNAQMAQIELVEAAE
jgi:large subunit ribosomal protein L17